MADSKRLVILKALTTHLQGITIANGFQHNLNGAKSVRRGIGVVSQDDPKPMIVITEPLNPDREPVKAGGSRRPVQRETWNLLIQGWAVDDADNPTDPAHNLMADVKKRIAELGNEESPNFRLGGLISDVTIEPGTVRPPEETSPLAFFWLRVGLDLTETVSDPYQLT